MRIGKYAFDSQEQAETKIKGLGVETDEQGNEYATHNHALVHLGHIVLEQGEYDEEGEETKAPVLSDKWHVDALWQHTYETTGEGEDAVTEIVEPEHPYGWKSYAVALGGNGVHSFYGLDYAELGLDYEAEEVESN